MGGLLLRLEKLRIEGLQSLNPAIQGKNNYKNTNKNNNLCNPGNYLYKSLKKLQPSTVIVAVEEIK
jgi:hypothetical protein